MKKLLLLCIFLLSLATASFAQHDGALKITVGPELGFATGDLSNFYSVSYGATGQLEIKMQENIMATITSGIIFFNGKSVGGGYKVTGLSVIPVRIGGKYYFTSGIYGAFQAGVGFFNKGGSAFAYSPQLGYEFLSKGGKGFDLAFKFDGYVNSINGLAVRFAMVL